MKRFLLGIAGLQAIAASGAQADNALLLPSPEYDPTFVAQVSVIAYPFPDLSTDRLEWLPLEVTESHYGWMNWTYTYSYDGDNRLIESTELCDQWDSEAEYHYTYTYDAQGKISGVELSQYDQATDGYRYAYDTVCPGVLISSERYASDGTDLCLWLGKKSDVERDAQGNVTAVTFREYNSSYGNEWWTSGKMTVTYGDEGLPATISEEHFDWRGNPTYSLTLSQLDWAECDGQIFSALGVVSGSNRILYARMEQGDFSSYITVSYPDSSSAVVTASVTTPEEAFTRILDYTLLPEGRSYRSVVTTLSDLADSVDESTTTDMKSYDRYGFRDEIYKSVTTDGIETIKEWDKVTYTRNDEGRPISAKVEEYLSETDTWVTTDPYLTFSSWRDNSAVEMMPAPEAGGDARYYTPSGLLLKDVPESGLYIERRGSESRKILVR